jgi:hypothetical protein
MLAVDADEVVAADVAGTERQESARADRPDVVDEEEAVAVRVRAGTRRAPRLPTAFRAAISAPVEAARAPTPAIAAASSAWVCR